MTRRALTPAELDFLAEPRGLARLATVDASGVPHVVPSGWRFDQVTGELLLTGHHVGGTRRARHLRDHPFAAAVIDGVDTSKGWHPWALTMRGPARYAPEVDAIRLTPLDVASWGLGELPARSADVPRAAAGPGEPGRGL